MTPDDRLAADVFGLTYREYAAFRAEDYRLRLLAPDAVRNLRQGQAQRWSPEKLADYLNTDAPDALFRLRRFSMSERVNAGRDTPERISRLFAGWLERFDLGEGERKDLARDLSRLLSSQLQVAAGNGESLADVIDELEKAEGGSPANPSTGSGTAAGGAADATDPNPKPWGPQWRD
jgi:hypothetical protein